MRENKKINIMLNLLKGFACVGVVFIHMPFPGNFGKIISTLSGFAVPLFFMIAGYYSFGNGPEVIKRRLSKIITLAIFLILIFRGILLMTIKIIFCFKNIYLSYIINKN